MKLFERFYKRIYRARYAKHFEISLDIFRRIFEGKMRSNTFMDTS